MREKVYGFVISKIRKTEDEIGRRENTMTLYHGSDQIIKTPELRHSVRTLDFGPGFYTTTNKEQAIDFAIKVYNRSIRAGITSQGKYVNIYNVDYEKMQKELNILHFKSADEDWFDFVIANRRNIWQGEKYDIIFGPVANDTIYRTLIAFEAGELSKTETIARLKVRKLFDQMTFTSEKALSFLEFSDYMEFSNV